MDSFSLVENFSEQWRAATQVAELIGLADDVLTQRQLRLFRASCCATLLPFMDQPHCSEAVRALELLAEGRLTYDQHHDDYVMPMVANVPILLRYDINEASFRMASFMRQYFRRIFSRWREICDDSHLRNHPNELVLAIFQCRIGLSQKQIANCNDEIETVAKNTLINSNWRAIQSDTYRIHLVEVLRAAGLTFSDWTPRNDIDNTIWRETELAEARSRAYYPCPDAPRHDRAYYQHLHCHIFREIVPGPDFPIDRVKAWRTAASLAAAQEIDCTRNFIRMYRLADAVAEAGCEDLAVFDHCERTDPAIRGSWLVDLILGK